MLSGLAVPLAAGERGRAPIVETVDLLVPMRPATVTVAGRDQIVHELHITNFLPVEIVLRSVEVLNGTSAPPLVEHRGDALGGRIGRPGLPRVRDDPQRVEPGMRAIVYFWIEQPAGGAIPTILKHRVELDIVRPAGLVRATVEGGVARLSEERAVVLTPPLRGGSWTAIYDPALRGGHRTVPYTVEGRARIPGRFAIDWVKLPASGRLEADVGTPGLDRNGFGSEVLAVADAVVAAAMDDVPDTRPSSGARSPVALEEASGNYVVLDLGAGRFAFYEHLQHGSLTVRAGDRVTSGQTIGRLGNSGSSSIGPHLHFHVADGPSLLGAEGLPFVFSTFDHVGEFSSLTAFKNGGTWHARPEADARRMERPVALSVVRFPAS